MKVIVLHAYGPASALRYEDAPDPVPAAGEALVRIHAASINPVDWMLRSGVIRDPIPITFPYILGIDVAGVVEALGDDVQGFSVGDRVMALASGAYAELCTVRAEHLVRAPEGVGLDELAALPLVNALDDDGAIDALPELDAVADTVGGDLASRLLGKVKPGGRFGCFPSTRGAVGDRAGVDINSIFAQADPAATLRYAEAVRDGALAIPVSRKMALSVAGQAHVLAEAGAGGKILLLP